MTNPVQEVAAEILAMKPADRFEVVAALLREDRPEMARMAWSIAERTVAEHGAAEAIARLREPPSAERGLARMRANLRGGS